MISLPLGFASRMDQDTVVLEHDDMILRYTERVRPIVSIHELWGDVLPHGEVLELLSDEGELVEMLEGRHDDERGHLTRYLSALAGDDFLAVIDAICTRPEHASELGALVEELACTDRHMLGIRRRPYRHQRPRGWIAEPRGALYAYYRPQGHDVTIYVPPAVPREMTSVDTLLGSLGLSTAAWTAEVHAAASGGYYEACIDDEYRRAFVLEDEAYLYAGLAVADRRSVALGAAGLDAVMQSAERLPGRPRTAVIDMTWMVD